MCVCVRARTHLGSGFAFSLGNFHGRLPWSGYHGNTGGGTEVETKGKGKGCYLMFVCTCALLFASDLMLSLWTFQPAETTWSHGARAGTRAPRSAQVCVFRENAAWLHVCGEGCGIKKVRLRQMATLRLARCIIRQSISRLSGQLINETIPFGWPPLSLACASKLLPRSPGYDRAAVAGSPIEPPG